MGLFLEGSASSQLSYVLILHGKYTNVPLVLEESGRIQEIWSWFLGIHSCWPQKLKMYRGISKTLSNKIVLGFLILTK